MVSLSDSKDSGCLTHCPLLSYLLLQRVLFFFIYFVGAVVVCQIPKTQTQWHIALFLLTCDCRGCGLLASPPLYILVLCLLFCTSACLVFCLFRRHGVQPFLTLSISAVPLAIPGYPWASQFQKHRFQELILILYRVDRLLSLFLPVPLLVRTIHLELLGSLASRTFLLSHEFWFQSFVVWIT